MWEQAWALPRRKLKPLSFLCRHGLLRVPWATPTRRGAWRRAGGVPAFTRHPLPPPVAAHLWAGGRAGDQVATRSDLARRWHNLMDINAGSIADGSKTIEEVGWEMFRLMLEVASGHKKTWAEHWKLHNALVLFNPAPVT